MKEWITESLAPRILAVAEIPDTPWECSLAHGGAAEKEQHRNQNTHCVERGQAASPLQASVSSFIKWA